MNQIELEQEMVDGGRARALGHIKRNEDQGQGYNNPYAQAMYRRFIEPLAQLIEAYINKQQGGGVLSRSNILLRDYDPNLLAFMTVRAMIGEVSSEEARLTTLSMSLGQSVYGEKLLVTGNPDVTDDEQLLAKLGLKGHRIAADEPTVAAAGGGCGCAGACQ